MGGNETLVMIIKNKGVESSKSSMKKVKDEDVDA